MSNNLQDNGSQQPQSPTSEIPEPLDHINASSLSPMGITSPEQMNLRQMISSTDWSTRVYAYEALAQTFAYCDEPILEEYGILLPKILQDVNLNAQKAGLNALGAWLDRGQLFHGKLKAICKPVTAAVIECALGSRSTLVEAGKRILQKLLLCDSDDSVWEAMLLMAGEDQKPVLRRGALEGLISGVELVGTAPLSRLKSLLVKQLPTLLTSREADVRLTSITLCELICDYGESNILSQLNLASLPQRTQKQVETLLQKKVLHRAASFGGPDTSSNSLVRAHSDCNEPNQKTGLRTRRFSLLNTKTGMKSGLSRLRKDDSETENSLHHFEAQTGRDLEELIMAAFEEMQSESSDWEKRQAVLASITAQIRAQADYLYSDLDVDVKHTFHTLLGTFLMDPNLKVFKQAAALAGAAADCWGYSMAVFAVSELFPRLFSRMGDRNSAVQQCVSDVASNLYSKCCHLSQMFDPLSIFLTHEDSNLREQTLTWLWWVLQKCTRDFREEPDVFVQLVPILINLTEDSSKECRDVACLALAQIVASLAHFGAEKEVYDKVALAIEDCNAKDHIALMAQSLEAEIDPDEPNPVDDQDSSLIAPSLTEKEPEGMQQETESDRAQTETCDLEENTNDNFHDCEPYAAQEATVTARVTLLHTTNGVSSEIEATVSIPPESRISALVENILQHIELTMFPDEDLELKTLVEETTQSELDRDAAVGDCVERFGELKLLMFVHVGQAFLDGDDRTSFDPAGEDDVLQTILLSYEEEGKTESLTLFNEIDDENLLLASQALESELKTQIISETDAQYASQNLMTPGRMLNREEREASLLLDACLSMLGDNTEQEEMIFSPLWTQTDEASIHHIVPPSDAKTKKSLSLLRSGQTPKQKGSNARIPMLKGSQSASPKGLVSNRLSLIGRFDDAANDMSGTPNSEALARQHNRSVFAHNTKEETDKAQLLLTLEKEVQEPSNGLSGDFDSDSFCNESSVKSSSNQRRHTAFNSEAFDDINSKIQQALECLAPVNAFQQKQNLSISGLIDETDSTAHRKAKIHQKLYASKANKGSHTLAKESPKVTHRPGSPQTLSEISMEYDSDDDYSQLRELLDSLHLTKHYSILKQNQVTLEVLKNLTEQELTEIGLPLGARKRIVAFFEDGKLLVSSRMSTPLSSPLYERRSEGRSPKSPASSVGSSKSSLPVGVNRSQSRMIKPSQLKPPAYKFPRK